MVCILCGSGSLHEAAAFVLVHPCQKQGYFCALVDSNTGYAGRALIYPEGWP